VDLLHHDVNSHGHYGHSAFSAQDAVVICNSESLRGVSRCPTLFRYIEIRHLYHALHKSLRLGWAVA
jgi:hypothetical protein